MPHFANAFLSKYGHDVHNVYDEALGGQSDTSVAAACQREKRTLLTLDVDFCNVKRYPPSEYSGIIVLRPHRQTFDQISEILFRIAEKTDFTEQSVSGHIWVVTAYNIRIL